MKVSVIIPIYNVSRFLGKCLNSVCKVQKPEVEIILVDDGSVDNSGDICDKYAKMDERVKVIHKRNGGLVSARKAGLEIAVGEYVFCVDGDDWISPDCISKMLDFGHGADIICAAAYEEYENGMQAIRKNTVNEGLYANKDELSQLYRQMLMNGNFFEMGVLPYQWGKIIKRELLIRCQRRIPDDVSYAEDVACTFPCLLDANSVYVSNEPVYHYRMQINSMVNEQFDWRKIQMVIQILKEKFENHAQAEDLEKQLYYYSWQSQFLKRYPYTTRNKALFPFEKVRNGMRVAVYGAGLFGRNVVRYCTDSSQLTLAGWHDKNYRLYTQRGLDVTDPSELTNEDFDVLVIAILNQKLGEKIKKSLVDQGIPADKIDYVRVETLRR